MTYFSSTFGRTLGLLLPLLLSLFLLCGLLSYGAAQTFGIALSYDDVLEPEVQLREIDLGPSLIDLRVADGVSGPLEVGAALRFRNSFGPLGTVSVTGHADFDTRGAFEVGADASGALASTGLDGTVSIFNRNPGAFAPTAAYTLGSRSFLPVTNEEIGETRVGAHLAVGAAQRLGRTLILETTPSLYYLAGTGLGAGLEARLQVRRLVERDNGVILLEGNTGPGAGRGFAAFGAEYQLNRRGLPPLTGAVLLGRGSEGVRPGFRGSAAGELGRFSYRAELAAEPYRETAPPYRANLALGTELGPGALGLEFGAALQNDFGVPPVLLRSSYALRF